MQQHISLIFLFLSIFIQIQANLFAGRTTAAPGWKRVGNHSYYAIPLIATGNTMPLLRGEHGNFVPHETLKYTVFGSMDGTGIEVVGDQYYVYVNHEYSSWHQTSLPGSSEIFLGARMSLIVFTKDWQIVGGRNLVTSKKSASTGASIDQPFGGLCAASFVESGFVGGAYFISSEEGDGGYASWAVSVKDGVATRIEGCGALHHENTVVASNYLPLKNHPAKKTVFLTTDDSASGEVFLFTGDQTSSDPNGFSSGTLHVLRVESLSFEEMQIGTIYTGSWTPIPHDVAFGLGKDGYNALDAWVNEADRSTNFRKIEDINEDPNNPGTFYFAATGGPFPVNSSVVLTNAECGTRTLIGGCDNPFGKIYKLTISPNDPTSTATLELVLEGSFENGGGYDNLCITRDGEILILEDTTPTALSEIYKPNNRYPQVLNYGIQSKKVTPMFEVDYNSLEPNTAPYSEHMSHSGIVEFGDRSNPMFMIALQGAAFDVPGDALSDAGLKIFSGQLAILAKLDHISVTPDNKLVSFGAIQPATTTVVIEESSANTTGLIIALVIGWVLAVGFAIIAVVLYWMKLSITQV